MTHTELLERVESAVDGRVRLGEETLEFLEEALIEADIGVKTTMALLDGVRSSAGSGDAGDPVKLRQMLVDEAAILLMDTPRPVMVTEGPIVTLLVGVNGVGKTTTAAKLARRSQQDGNTVLLAAADTFRAAAVEQLALWGSRLDIRVIQQGAGADPAAVVFDAIQAGKARGVRHLIVDTAGRLHTKTHLMAELAKMKRVVEREAPDWLQQTVLVLDATTGQNGVIQAREFAQATPLDGIILAKVDGTAKGGVVVAIARELELPILYLGVGESVEDLVEFRPREFATALFG